MKIIKLFNNRGEVKVDDEDYNWLMTEYGWRILIGRKTNYAISRGYKVTPVLMHRLIMEKYYGKSNLDVDHKNRNGLDNRKENLRYVTFGQNMVNIEKYNQHKTSSKYKGVHFLMCKKIWKATTLKNNKLYHIGYFENERDAAIAYDIFVSILHNGYAWLNIPNVSDEDRLRVENIMSNPKKFRNTSSKYLGVSKHKRAKDVKWRAYFCIDKKTIYLGLFDSEEYAALEYNKKAIELLGDKARLNIINAS